jgi:hypothetical protein
MKKKSKENMFGEENHRCKNNKGKKTLPETKKVYSNKKTRTGVKFRIEDLWLVQTLANCL